jgi:hypothetical protein
LCTGCRKNFSETPVKFWFALKEKDKMNTALYDLLWGYRIRKSAKETGTAMQTSFDWRPKFGTSFYCVSVFEFKAIVARDALFFPISEKGNRTLERTAKKQVEEACKLGMPNEKVAVIAACDRSINKGFEVVTTGRISKKNRNKLYRGKLDTATVHCNKSYGAFGKSNAIIYKKCNASKGQKTVAKIEHV